MSVPPRVEPAAAMPSRSRLAAATACNTFNTMVEGGSLIASALAEGAHECAVARCKEPGATRLDTYARHVTSACVKGTAAFGGTLGVAAGAVAAPVLGAAAWLNPAERLAYEGSATPFDVWQRREFQARIKGSPDEAHVRVARKHLWVHQDSDAAYQDDAVATVRLKSLLLATLGQPVLGAINLAATLVVMPAIAIARAVRGDGEKADLGGVARRAMLAIPTYLALEVAAVVGIVAPLTGRRLFARLEAGMAGRVAPCFQPLGPWSELVPLNTTNPFDAEPSLKRSDLFEPEPQLKRSDLFEPEPHLFGGCIVAGQTF